MKIVITESQLKILLSEVKKTCPDGWDYSGDAERCIKTRELPQLEVVAFQNDDNDKSISKSFIRYINLYRELSNLYEENGMALEGEYYWENLKKPLDGYSVEFFDTLLMKVMNKYQIEYDNFEIAKREKFIEQEVKPMIGKPYVWGKFGPEFNDCSGLICQVFELGWKHNAQMLYDKSNLFYDVSDVQVGDIVYFDYDPDNEEDEKPIDHVGIISEKRNNKLWMIHASGNSECTEDVIDKYKDNKKKCKVKEVRFTNHWKKQVAAFGKLKTWEFT